MIDTVILVIEQDMFAITDPNKFGFRSTSDLFQKAGHDRIVKNPTIAEYKTYGYLPCLTLQRRMVFGKSQLGLRIQFSVPKALYGNNFDEVIDSDIDKLVTWLHDRLHDWAGVYLMPHFIHQAEVSGIHYSKNLVFENSYRCQYILQQISKADITQRLGFNKCDYQNEGICLKYRTNSFEFALYDKVKDLEQARISPKKSEEKLEAVVQLSLLNSLIKKAKESTFEVLRLEVRLNRREVIKKKIAEAGKEIKSLEFGALFKCELSQAVVLNQFDKIIANYPQVVDTKFKSKEEVLLQLQVSNPQAPIIDILAMYATNELLKTYSMREIRSMIRTKSNDQWYRYKNKVNQWSANQKLPHLFPTIRQMLIDYHPLHFTDYSTLMLNDVKLE